MDMAAARSWRPPMKAWSDLVSVHTWDTTSFGEIASEVVVGLRRMDDITTTDDATTDGDNCDPDGTESDDEE